MGEYKLPPPVKLTISLLSETAEKAHWAHDQLQREFGPIEHSISPFPYLETNYYESEVGSYPVRSLIAFHSLIPRESLVEIKRQTNELEKKWFAGIRKVNLDPGYLTLGQFFLATTKDQRQRTYIRDGIFMEPCLYFEKKQWHPFAWTYFEYRKEKYLQFFQDVRRSLAKQVKT